jgi:hypothetical protein
MELAIGGVFFSSHFLLCRCWLTCLPACLDYEREKARAAAAAIAFAHFLPSTDVQHKCHEALQPLLTASAFFSSLLQIHILGTFPGLGRKRVKRSEVCTLGMKRNPVSRRRRGSSSSGAGEEAKDAGASCTSAYFRGMPR